MMYKQLRGAGRAASGVENNAVFIYPDCLKARSAVPIS